MPRGGSFVKSDNGGGDSGHGPSRYHHVVEGIRGRIANAARTESGMSRVGAGGSFVHGYGHGAEA